MVGVEGEIGGEKSGGKQKVAHELRFDSEAVRVRETKHGGSATVAHQGDGLGETDKVKNGLKPAPSRDDETTSKEDTPKSVGEVLGELNNFTKGEEAKNREIDEPKDPDSKETAEKVRCPSKRESEKNREKKPGPKFFKMQRWARLDQENETKQIEEN